MASTAPLNLARSLPTAFGQGDSSYSIWCLSDGTPFTKGLNYPVHYDSVISSREKGAFWYEQVELEPPSRPQGWSTEEWRIACDAVAHGVTVTIFERMQ